MQSSKQYKDTRYEGVDYLLKTLDKAGISIEFDEKQCSSNEEGIYLLDERKIIFRDDKPSVHVLKHQSWLVLQHCRMWNHDDTKSITFYQWKEPFEDFINASGIDANKLTNKLSSLFKLLSLSIIQILSQTPVSYSEGTNIYKFRLSEENNLYNL